MRFQDFVLIFAINCVIIYILHTFQKKAINESLKNLKKEIGDLENLVAAIIEEFEEIADSVIPKESDRSDDKPFNNSKEPFNHKFLASFSESDESRRSPGGVIELNNFDKPSADFEDSVSLPFSPRTVSEPAASNIESISETAQVVSNNGKSQRQIELTHIKDPKHKQILELWNQGLAIEEISKKLEKGRGEIQLVLGLYKRS